MDFESQNCESTENLVPVLSATISNGDVRIDSNGSNAHDDVYDPHTNGNGCSESNLDLKKQKEEAEELNCIDHENLESSPGYGSLHTNRSMSGEAVDADTAVSLVNSGEKDAEDDLDVADACVSPGMLPPLYGMKGKGLRKWRRIRREFVKDGTPNIESAKMLKRGSSDLVNSTVVIGDMKQKSDGSESSVNGILHNVSNKLAGSSTSSAGTGSDEDLDSKSSTAASVPESRNDIPRPSGHSRDKDKTKHTSGEHLDNAPQPLHQGLGKVDASKKPRGEAVNMDKENSLSSPDSESGSYSYVFTHCMSSGINNGQSDRGTYDGEHGDDGPAGEQKSVEQPPTCPGSAEDEEISKGQAALSWKTRGRDTNHQISGNWDPLVDCVQTLQSTQEALEQEIQKLGELGRDLRPFDDDSIRTSSVGPEFCVVSSSESPTSDFGTEIPDVLISLTKNIEIFEKQIQETKNMLREKETKIDKLQASVNNLKSSNEDLQRSINVQQKLYEEVEAEVDTLCKEKMEAEILYLAIADTSIVAENQMKLLLTEQKSLVSARAQDLQKVANLECRAANLKDKAEGRLTSGKGTAGAEAGNMQKGIIAKFTFYFLIQLILLVCVFEMFISQFMSNTTVVLPT